MSNTQMKHGVWLLVGLSIVFICVEISIANADLHNANPPPDPNAEVSSIVPPAAVQPVEVTREEYIVDVYLRHRLNFEGMFCRLVKKRLFIPLGEFADILSFPITVDDKGATGWFLSKDKQFIFALDTGEASVAGQQFVVPHKDYFNFDGEIYLELKWYNEFFSLGMTLDKSLLILHLNPEELLPMELAEQRRNNRRMKLSKEGLRYPLRDLDYAAVALPHLETKLRLGHSGSRKSETSKANFTGLYRGDLLFMSALLYGAVDYSKSDRGEEYKIGNLSVTAERILADNPYLTKIELGDIVPTSTPMAGSGALERGVRISNTPMFTSTTYDTKTFTGKTLPGWEVELYRNNQFVGYETVGEDGTYSFENIELYFGMNRIKLVTYGTEGQESVREEIINVASTLGYGDVRYDASYSQKGVGVFDKEFSRVSPVTPSEQGTDQFKGTVNVGLGMGIGVQTGLTLDKKDMKKRAVGSAGVDFGIKDYLAQFSVGHSSYDSSTMLSGSIRGQLPGGQTVNLEAMQQLTDRYQESSLINMLGGSIQDSAKVGTSTHLTYGGSLSRANNKAGESKEDTYYTVAGNLNLNAGWGHFSNNLSAQHYEKASGSQTDSLSGTASIYKRLNEGSLRGILGYGYNEKEKAHVGSFSGTGTYRPTSRVSTSLNIRKSFVDNHRLSVSNTWSYGFGKTTPYLTWSWADDETYSFYTGVSTSLDFDPDTFMPTFGIGQASGASCAVYNDKNYNNLLDEEDDPIGNVVLQAAQARQRALTNENGRALFYRLQSLKSTDISIDDSSLPDPRMHSGDGVAVTPRYGRIYDLEFPVHLCGEVEGYVYLLANDEAKGKPNIPIQLISDNGTVVAEGWSESGGFFFIEKALPGTYSLRIAPGYLEMKGLVGTTVHGIVITPKAEVVTGKLLFLGTPKNVTVLAKKFETELLFREEIELFANFENLDAPATKTAQHPTRLKLSEITDAKSTLNENEELASQDQLSSSDIQPKEMGSSHVTKGHIFETIQEGDRFIPVDYALALDVFVSARTAKRAVVHYTKRYATELSGYKVSYQKENDGYTVLVLGINNKRKMEELANVFLCRPKLVKVIKVQ